jgi:hypothetical protein
MNLANPAALAWGLLAVPVVIFYILKIRLKRVPVSTVLFWQQIFDEKKPRSIWQRLRHLVSLVVQLALLGLLVAALAEPFFPWEALSGRSVILVLDNSASMNATDVSPTRLARAKEEAHRVIGGLRFRDEMAIVLAGAQPRVICGLTGHLKTLRQAVDDVAPTDGPTQLREAIAIARRLTTEIEGYGTSQIVVVTDGCAEGAAALSKEENVTFVTVGQRTPNLAITRFQVRRSTVDAIGYEILAEVTNFSDEPTGDFRLSIALNGNPVDIKPLNLAANARWSEVIESITSGGGLLTAELVVKVDKDYRSFPDALACDNKAVAVLPRRDPMPVTLLSPEGNLFLHKVLEASPLVRLTTAKEIPKEFPAGAVTVFHRQTPAKLPPGPVLVVDPIGDCDLWKTGEKMQSPIVTTQNKDSPLMAHVRLDNVLMPEARKLTFTPAAGTPQVLAATVTGDSLFALIDRPEGKVVVLTVNLDFGDLPFRTAFPILAMNTLNFFAGSQGELREALPTGATVEFALPTASTGVGAYLLRAPDGSTRKLPSGSTKTTIGPLDQCGIWSVVPDAKDAVPITEFAVNLMNKAESDLRPPEGLEASKNAAEAGLSGGFFGGPAWWYLTGFALCLAVTEWYLYQRRWIS